MRVCVGVMWLLIGSGLVGLMGTEGRPSEVVYSDARNGVNSAGAAKPNVVVILADDLGYGDVTGFGSVKHRTLALDKMGEDGARLSQCYAAAPICTPSRAGV